MLGYYSPLKQDIYRLQIENSRIEPLSILYGKDAVKHIEKIIVEFLKHDISFLEDLVKDMLRILRFSCKKEKYRKENEVRIVIFITKDIVLNDNYYFENDNYDYLFVEFPRCYYFCSERYINMKNENKLINLLSQKKDKIKTNNQSCS